MTGRRESHAGGAYGKVIRWAFEKQGLFQPAGAPTPRQRARRRRSTSTSTTAAHGEYQFQPNHWSSQAIWNRRHGRRRRHQEPVVGGTNYAYVQIKNRGTQSGDDVVVKGFHANPAARASSIPTTGCR